MKVNDFRELEVYKKMFELQQEIFDLTKRFPREEQYFLDRSGQTVIALNGSQPG